MKKQFFLQHFNRLQAAPQILCSALSMRQPEQKNPHRRLGQLLSSERGQSLIVLVISMAAIIALMALAIDGGFVYANHSRMQTAADAAALSGARMLAMGESESTAIAQASAILVANGADLGESTIAISGGTQMNVTAVTPFDTFFAGMLGANQVDVAADASAVFGSIVSTGSVLPLAVPEEWWLPNTSVTLYDSDAGVGPGNWGWVNWGSRGNAKNNVVPPLSGAEISIGQWIESEPGNNTSATQAVRDYWVGQSVTMFLYDTTNGETGRGMEYRVSGFAQFEITEVKATGNPKYIVGQFVDYVQLGGTIDPTGSTGNMGVALVASSGGTGGGGGAGGGGTASTSVPPTATTAAPTATSVPPTATTAAPTATSVSPTATTAAPTATSVSPTATTEPEPPPTHELVCVEWQNKNKCNKWE